MSLFGKQPKAYNENKGLPFYNSLLPVRGLLLRPYTQAVAMKHFFTTSKGHLRLSALLEGISFLLLLLIAMPLKYWAGIPEPVSVVGMAHGVLFVWYVLAVLAARAEFKISLKNTALALAASLLPLGTFYADSRIFKHLYRR